MIPRTGLNLNGSNSIDFILDFIYDLNPSKAVGVVAGHYKNDIIKTKDISNCEIILKHVKELDTVAIVGCNMPIAYMELLPAKKFKIIDDCYALSKVKTHLDKFYNFEIINTNPIFNDISEHLKDVDLVIFPETETLVPFDLLKYKTNKLKFCSNYFHYSNTLNINLVYDERDLTDICMIDKVIDMGRHSLQIENKKIRNCFYSLGY
jgi:hypothetical protein